MARPTSGTEEQTSNASEPEYGKKEIQTWSSSLSDEELPLPQKIKTNETTFLTSSFAQTNLTSIDQLSMHKTCTSISDGASICDLNLSHPVKTVATPSVDSLPLQPLTPSSTLLKPAISSKTFKQMNGEAELKKYPTLASVAVKNIKKTGDCKKCTEVGSISLQVAAIVRAQKLHLFNPLDHDANNEATESPSNSFVPLDPNTVGFQKGRNHIKKINESADTVAINPPDKQKLSVRQELIISLEEDFHRLKNDLLQVQIESEKKRLRMEEEEHELRLKALSLQVQQLQNSFIADEISVSHLD